LYIYLAVDFFFLFRPADMLVDFDYFVVHENLDVTTSLIVAIS